MTSIGPRQRVRARAAAAAEGGDADRPPRTRPGSKPVDPPVQDRPGADARWCSRTKLAATAPRSGAGTARTPSGRPVSPGTYLVAIETRDQAGNRGLSPPLNRRGLPATSYGAKLPGHGGITVRYLGVRPPNVADARGRPGRVLRRRAAQAVDLVGAPRRVDRRDAQPPQDLGARAPARARAASPASTSCRCAPPRAPRRCPFAVQSAKRHRVLVVLPVMTWQGRNSLDDDGDGLPNLLDRGVGAKLFRVYAGDGLPAGFADRDAPLLAWLDRRGHRYDITTDVALAAGRGPRLEDHQGVILPSDVRWLPRALQQRLRRYVRDGGRVATFGIDSLRRQVTLTAPRADGRPDAARDDRRLRRAPAPAERAAEADATSSTANDDIDFFARHGGRLRPLLARPGGRLTARRGRWPARSPRTRQTGRPVIAASAPGQGPRDPLRRARAAVAPVRARQRPEHHRPAGSDMDAPVPLILAALLAAGALVARGAARARRRRCSARSSSRRSSSASTSPTPIRSSRCATTRRWPWRARSAPSWCWRCWRCSSTAARRGCRSPPRRRCPSACRSPRAARRRTCSSRSTSSSRRARWPTRCRASPGGERAGGRARARGARMGARRLPGALRGPVELLRRLRPRAGERRLLLRPLRAALRARRAACAWTPRLARVCLGVLVVLALALVGVGFVEYATRHLFLNPKVIASNQLEDYFRVNSLFFDPNIYGRFLAIVMLLLAAWLLWARRQREVVAGALLLAVLWGGLVLTFSQSSFTALLVGLAILGAMRWSVRWALMLSGGRAGRRGRPSWPWRPGRSTSTSATRSRPTRRRAGATTSSRAALKLFEDAPLVGQGSGSFAREYRRAEHVSPERAASASHTIPVTVAAEQGRARPRRLPRAAGRGAGAAVPRRAARARARRGGGRLRGPGRALDDVRRVPRGPADVDAARAPGRRWRCGPPCASRRRHEARGGPVVVAALAVVALVAALLVPTYPNYDTYFHLVWGRELHARHEARLRGLRGAHRAPALPRAVRAGRARRHRRRAR